MLSLKRRNMVIDVELCIVDDKIDSRDIQQGIMIGVLAL
jgi:hypothetical protein